MKYIFYSILVGAILFLSSCEGEEFGFNISAETGFPLNDISYTVPEFTNPFNTNEFNPNPIESTISLSDVDAFQDDLNAINELGDVSINAIYYEITNVDEVEMVALDELSISVTTGGPEINLITLTDRLDNIPRTRIDLSQSDLTTLSNDFIGDNNILTNVNFDAAELPAEGININIQVFLDITLRIRNN